MNNKTLPYEVKPVRLDCTGHKYFDISHSVGGDILLRDDEGHYRLILNPHISEAQRDGRT